MLRIKRSSENTRKLISSYETTKIFFANESEICVLK